MKKLIIVLMAVVLLLVPVACTQETAPASPTNPAPEPVLAQIPALPAEDTIIEMSTVGTMSGMAKYLAISENGSIVYFEEEGPRIVLPGSSRSRTTKTGQLQDDELNRLPNGNTLITGTTKIVEITTEGKVVWQLRLKGVTLEGLEAARRGFYKAQRIGLRK